MVDDSRIEAAREIASRVSFKELTDGYEHIIQEEVVKSCCSTSTRVIESEWCVSCFTVFFLIGLVH